MFSANEILDLAIKLEQNGEAVYRGAAEKVSNRELAGLLEWMADEETCHANWFAELKLDLEQTDTNSFMEKMSREVFNDLLGEKNFSLKDVDFTSVEEIESLISIFIEFEDDSVRFYQVLELFIDDPSDRAHIKKIIDEEHNHIKRLQEIAGREEVFAALGK